MHALGTRHPENAETIASQNGIRNLYDNYEAVLRDRAVDAVYIPLPNHLHHPWTIRALEAGKHVLCEKPMALNARQAFEMAQSAEKNGRFLMEGFMYRFHPRSRRIRSLIGRGAIGRPCMVRSAFCFHMDDATVNQGLNVRMKQDLGGGVLLDVGCYGVSLARWMISREPEQVQAQAIYHNGGVDIHLVGNLRFPGGALATLEASFISALQQTFTVVGKNAAIDLPHNAFIPWEDDTAFILRQKDEAIGQTVVIPGADEYQLMVEHFGDVVLGYSEPDYHPYDSIRNMQVLDALAQAAKSGQTVRVDN